MNSLKHQLQQICRVDQWINGCEFEKYALAQGHKASNASRRMRELENAGIVEKKIENGSVWYRLVARKEVFKPEVIIKQRLLTLL